MSFDGVLAAGPAVVVFWHHFACGYRVERAERLRDELAIYRATGASILIIGQRPPVQAAAFGEERELDLPILTDHDRPTYRAYGLLDASLPQAVFDSPQWLWSYSEETAKRFIEHHRIAVAGSSMTRGCYLASSSPAPMEHSNTPTAISTARNSLIHAPSSPPSQGKPSNDTIQASTTSHPSVPLRVVYFDALGGVNPSSHQTRYPIPMPKARANRGEKSPPGHSIIGLPSHDLQRSQLGTPPMSSQVAVIVPMNVTTPATTDRKMRMISFAASITTG